MNRAQGRAQSQPDAGIIDSSWYDLAVSIVLLVAGVVYLWNAHSWGAFAYIGNDQFGDADFWWNGALQFADGIVWTNPNFAHRMGYAIFTGLLASVLGNNFLVYHKLLILLFLGTALVFYFSAKQAVGRATATGLAGILVFAPLHAEWLAVATSDATGLIWHLLALSCLILAITRAVRPAWTTACGVFLAFGNLTRPLMAPFIIPAAAFPLLARSSPARRRLLALAGLAVGFAVPLAIWTGLYHLNTGSVALAGHDSTTFYAASDPQIQVWSAGMYTGVEASARARNRTETLTATQLSREFWLLAVENYRNHWEYHWQRLGPHVLVMARFSYFDHHRNGAFDRTVPRLPVAASALLLAFGALTRGRWLNLMAVAGLAGVWLAGQAVHPILVIAAAVLFVQPFLQRSIGLVPRVIAAYWWIGVAALYFIGGTWGPPLAPSVEINALGYRLGAQFLFANDMLIVLALWFAATVPLPVGRRVGGHLLANWRDAVTGKQSRAAALVRWSRAAALSGLGALLLAGGILTAMRGWELVHAVPAPMPNAAAAAAAYCAAAGRMPPASLPTASNVSFATLAHAAPPDRPQEPILVTGGLGAAVWHFDAQGRTKAMFYQQELQWPFVWNGGHGLVEFAALLPEAVWRRRQGLWLLRTFREVGPHEGYVFYLADPQVQFFIPLKAGGAGYAAEEAVRFPLVQYAAQLAAAGTLTAVNGRIDWLSSSDGSPPRRWFNLMPVAAAPAAETRMLQVDVSAAGGRRTLSFAFRVEPVPGRVPVAETTVRVVVSGSPPADGDRAAEQRSLAELVSPARGAPVNKVPQRLDLPLDGDLRQITVAFEGIAATEMVRVIELKLIADDFAPNAAQRLCR